MDEKKIKTAIKTMEILLAIAKSYSDATEDVVHKEMVESIETAIEALEKQLAKKPKEMKYKPLRDFGWKYECPICRGACGENVYHYDITKDEMYCTTCGQKLDWSE